MVKETEGKVSKRGWLSYQKQKKKEENPSFAMDASVLPERQWRGRAAACPVGSFLCLVPFFSFPSPAGYSFHIHSSSSFLICTVQTSLHSNPIIHIIKCKLT